MGYPSSNGIRDGFMLAEQYHTIPYHTIHRVFGWRYYPLGVLKLLADSLGFAGPVLLGYLV